MQETAKSAEGLVDKADRALGTIHRHQGQNFPDVRPTFALVAHRQLAADLRRMQLALGQVVGRLHRWRVQKRYQVVALIVQATRWSRPVRTMARRILCSQVQAV